jgi:hypothetical protein
MRQPSNWRLLTGRAREHSSHAGTSISGLARSSVLSAPPSTSRIHARDNYNGKCHKSAMVRMLSFAIHPCGRNCNECPQCVTSHASHILSTAHCDCDRSDTLFCCLCSRIHHRQCFKHPIAAPLHVAMRGATLGARPVYRSAAAFEIFHGLQHHAWLLRYPVRRCALEHLRHRGRITAPQ